MPTPPRQERRPSDAAAPPRRFGPLVRGRCWATRKKPSGAWTRPWPRSDLPLFFHVSTLVARGATAAASATNPGEYEDHRFVYAKKLLGRLRCRQAQPSAGGARCRALCLEPDGPMEGRGGEQAVPGRLPYSLDQQGGEEPSCRDLRLPRSPWHGAMASRYRGNLDAARRTYKSVVDEIEGGPGGGPAPARRGRATEPTSVPSANGWAIPWNAGPIANSTAAPPPMEKSTSPRPPNPTTRPARSRPNGAMRW